MTLTEFLLARIAEDEKAIKSTVNIYDPYRISRFNKKRLALECAAKRRIVERASVECICTDHGHNRVDGCPQCVACHAVTMADGYVLADLALPYADHPDYDESWRPYLTMR